MKMSKLMTALAAGFFCAVIGTSAASANELKKVWGGGQPSASTYSGVYVPHIIEMMSKERLAGYEWGGESEGTVMNAELVTKNPTHVAIGQYDILRNLNGKPMPDGGTYQFTILHKDIGPECLYAVTSAEGYSNWGHILGNSWDLTVYTGGEKSGSYGTFQVLQELYPDLQDVIVEHAGGIDKIVEAAKGNPASFGFFIMRPDPNSEVFQTISEAGLTFVPVVDLDLEGSYDFLELKVAKTGLLGWGEGEYVTTACTSVAMITGDPENIDADDTRTSRRLEATIQRMQAVSSEQMKPTIADFSDMFNSIRKATAANLKDMYDAAKSSYDEALAEVAN